MPTKKPSLRELRQQREEHRAKLSRQLDDLLRTLAISPREAPGLVAWVKQGQDELLEKRLRAHAASTPGDQRRVNEAIQCLRELASLEDHIALG
jgi:hypothetical protein